MWVLEHPGPPRNSSVFANTPLVLVGFLGVSWLVAAGLAASAWIPPPLLRAVSVTAAHGGLLAVAMASAAAHRDVQLPRGCLLITTTLIGAGAPSAALDPRPAGTD